MGQRLIALAAADPELELVAALDAPNHPRLGEDAGIIAGSGRLDVPLAATLDVPAEVMIDFSVPEAAENILDVCRQKKIPLVTATTGLSEGQTAKLHAAAKEIPVLWAPNMSLAVNLTMKLAEVAARALKDKDADVEITRAASSLQGGFAERDGVKVWPDHRGRDGPDGASARPRRPPRQTPAQ